MFGSQLIKARSRTQTVVATSSAEAGLTGIAKGSTISLGLQLHCAEIGLACRMQTFSDSAAASSTCRRRKLDRVRHLAVADLWIQERIRSNDFALRKIPGQNHHADIMTKFVDRQTLCKHLHSMRLEEEQGRAQCASHIHSLTLERSWPAFRGCSRRRGSRPARQSQ